VPYPRDVPRNRIGAIPWRASGARLSPAILSLAIALVPAGVASRALAAESAPAPAIVPPALQALEQKMALIRFNSARFSTRLDLAVDDSSSSNAVSVSAVPVSAARSHADVIATTGVIGLSPPVLSSTSTIEGIAPGEALGGASLKERRIGATTYVYDPSATRRDGGRPWIRRTLSPSDQKVAAELAPLSVELDPLLAGLERPTATSTGPFAPLLEALPEAQSVQEAGPATVDGQQTLAFTFALSSAKLLEQALSSKERRRLAKGRQLPDIDFTLELWLAPSGLPVRALTRNGARGEEFDSQEDILNLEVPVLVHAPPADRTIGEAHWIAIERRRAKAVARCVRHHPRRAGACIKGQGGLK
jgi:hypothetical protein